jgi:hypothetical protein
VGVLPVPLQPDVDVLGVVAKSCFMFKSALYPAVITFKKKPDESALKAELEKRRMEAATRTDKNNSKISKLLGHDSGNMEDGPAASMDSLAGDRKSRKITQMLNAVTSLPPTSNSHVNPSLAEECVGR